MPPSPERGALGITSYFARPRDMLLTACVGPLRAPYFKPNESGSGVLGSRYELDFRNLRALRCALARPLRSAAVRAGPCGSVRVRAGPCGSVRVFPTPHIHHLLLQLSRCSCTCATGHRETTLMARGEARLDGRDLPSFPNSLRPKWIALALNRGHFNPRS